jgi:hypothetical protein
VSTNLIRPTRRFHLVSQVILRQFCNATGELRVFDLMHPSRSPKLKGPRKVCFLSDSDINPPDPLSFEELWGGVETDVPPALVAMRNGILHDDAKSLETLRNCLALHWARSQTLATMIEPVTTAVLDRAERRMREDPNLISPSGLTPAGPEARSLFARAMRNRVEAIGFDLARLVPERFTANFHEAKRRVENQPVEIVVASGSEFLIGDCPALSLSTERSGVGPLGGVPWDQATTVFMPLDRRHAMGLGKTNKYMTFDAAQVAQLNRAQVIGAQKVVLWHPDADFTEYVRKILDEKSPTLK